MQKQFDKLENKLDRLDQRLDNIDVTLAAQHVSIAEHIRRTKLLEDRAKEIEQDVAPIKKHVAMVHGALKLIGLIATIATIAEVVLAVIK